MAKSGIRALLSRRRVRVLLGLCVLLIAAMIFYFSSQDGTQSTETSDAFVKLVLRLFFRDFDAMTSAERQALRARLSLLVRKGAHFLEYAALGFFLHLFLRSLRTRRAGLFAWLGGTAYAATDELHQLFTSARAGMWQDVALDSAGALFGCLAALAAIPLILRWRRQKTE